MVLDRKTASAALALVVIVLSQWPVVDSPPFPLAIFLCGGVLVAVLGVSERARASRLVIGAVGMLFVLQGAYEIIRGHSWIDFAVGVLYSGLGVLVVIYQSGFAPWGTPRSAIDNR